MSKRSVQEKIEHYQRKVRKLNKQNKKRRRILPLDSSEEEDLADSIICDPQNDAPQNDLDEHHCLPPTEERLPSEGPQDAVAGPSTEAPSVPCLDLELLSALGVSTSDTPAFGEPIHENLANLWLPLLRKGLPKEEKGSLMKEYLIPSNCKLLQAPKLNAEISAATSDLVRTQDKKLENFQLILGAGTSAINRAMDLMLRMDDKVRALKCLSDGCRLLTDLHHSFSCDRKKLITPYIDRNVLHMIQDTERDETLFGNTLAEKIRASKAIEKQGFQIRKVANQKTITPIIQMTPARPTQQGNWTGPPRYPSFRGGRGGQRRPALSARRPYHSTSMSHTASSKNFSQSKSRANVHQ